MPTKRLFVPDDILQPAPSGEDKHIRLLQYVNATTQENVDAFLTHHALVYILSGVKQIKVAQNKFDIHPGELFLIPRGEYVMSEYITGEYGFRSFMLFFSKKTAQTLIEQIDKSLLTEHLSRTANATLTSESSPGEAKKKEAIKIIPPNRDIEQLFLSLEKYSQQNSPFLCELIRLKFSELIYLLMDSSYKTLIFNFLLDAARSEIPSLSSILDSHLYTSATIEQLAILSGRSLSSFKREFTRQYNEPPRTWIRKKKLERAAFLLTTTDRSIDQISEASGFASAPHFTRLFKEHYASTPSEYRTKQIVS